MFLKALQSRRLLAQRLSCPDALFCKDNLGPEAARNRSSEWGSGASVEGLGLGSASVVRTRLKGS